MDNDADEWMNNRPAGRLVMCVPLLSPEATIHTIDLEPRRENGYGEIHISSCLMQPLARYAVLFALLLRSERPSDERLKVSELHRIRT